MEHKRQEGRANCMEHLIVVDSYGNRFFEFFEDNGQLSGFDYTKRKLIQGDEAKELWREIDEGIHLDLLQQL